ncbi:MAG: hypothetical protein LBQ05_02725, partial [Christensenellaceae bacterium]|nr:hypothetical protein [Christensenellaceae bacterium]
MKIYRRIFPILLAAVLLFFMLPFSVGKSGGIIKNVNAVTPDINNTVVTGDSNTNNVAMTDDISKLLEFNRKTNELINKYQTDISWTREGGVLVSTTKYETKRLVVTAKDGYVPDEDSEWVGGYKNQYILQYQTEEAAAAEYNRLLNDNNIESVYVDFMVRIDATNPLQNYQYKTWGAGISYMNMKTYNEYLLTLPSSNLDEVVVAVV